MLRLSVVCQHYFTCRMQDTMTFNTNTTSTPSMDSMQPTNSSSLSVILNTTYPSEELLSPAGHYAMGTVLAIIALVGMLQNSLTLIALNKKPNSPRIAFLIKVVLVTDLSICVLNLPFAVTSSFARRWLFGPVGCNWYGFSMFFLGVFSINVVTAICIERYFTVRQIMQVPASAKTRLLVISLVVSALGALLWSVLPLLGVSSYTHEGVGTSCSVDWKSKKPQDQAYFVVILICCFIVPLSVIVTCYSQIYIKVTSRPWSADMLQQSRLAQTRIKMEIHLAKTIFLAAGSYILAWSPYAVVSLVAILTDPETIPPIVFNIPAIFAKCSVFGNSFAYVFMNRDLRHICLEKLGLMKNRAVNEEVLALPNTRQQRIEPYVIAPRPRPQEMLFEMTHLRPIGGCNGVPQLGHHSSTVSSQVNRFSRDTASAIGNP